MGLLEIFEGFKEQVETEKEALELSFQEAKKWKYLVKAHKHTQGQFDIESRKCHCFATEGVGIEILEDMGVSLTSYHDNEHSYLANLLEEQEIEIEETENDCVLKGCNVSVQAENLFEAVEDLRRDSLVTIMKYEEALHSTKQDIESLRDVATINLSYAPTSKVLRAKSFEEAYEEMEAERFENACGDWTIKVYKTDELEAWELEEMLGVK